jgi:hypothetical protein
MTALKILWPTVVGIVLAIIAYKQYCQYVSWSGDPAPSIGPVFICFLGGIGVSLVIALAELSKRSPAAYQDLKDLMKLAGAAYVAYEVVEGVRRHERREDYRWEQRQQRRNDRWQQ